jgi:mannose/fructose/N-acetylgalactosamine-specific phosphotransferase system component IIB
MDRIRKLKWGIVLVVFINCSAIPVVPEANKTDEFTKTSLTLVPPSPVTNKVKLDIRGAVWNNSNKAVDYRISLYVDNIEDDFCIYNKDVTIQPGNNSGIQFWLDTEKHAGNRNIIMVVKSKSGTHTLIEPVKIIDSKIRSTKRIDGSWFEFYHWSEDEGRFWNKDIVKLSNGQWEELIKGMHDIEMNIVVIQELFRNQKYVGQHTMESTGYTGFPYYQSKLYPLKPGQSLLENVENGKSSENYPKWKNIAADSALESVLSEADERGMKVFLGVGMYAWFDFSQGSLDWSKKVAKELWERFGSHKSFYGWYISGEIAGNLGENEKRKKEIVHFFEEFTPYVRTLAPDKPVMLATNCHDVKNSNGYYPALLKNLDILCPFGFHRMPPNDYTGKEVAKLLQDYCDKAGSHLWMDLEVFLFAEKNALYPRPIDQVVTDLLMFDNFEKICCYSYTGLMNAGWQTARPGGERTIKLYNDYMNYLMVNSFKKQISLH